MRKLTTLTLRAPRSRYEWFARRQAHGQGRRARARDQPRAEREAHQRARYGVSIPALTSASRGNNSGFTSGEKRSNVDRTSAGHASGAGAYLSPSAPAPRQPFSANELRSLDCPTRSRDNERRRRRWTLRTRPTVRRRAECSRTARLEDESRSPASRRLRSRGHTNAQ